MFDNKMRKKSVMNICQRLVDAANYLEIQGMSTNQLRSLHHSIRRTETYMSTRKYFGINKELRPINVAYANRLIHIAEQHQAKQGSISILISEALLRWPL